MTRNECEIISELAVFDGPKCLYSGIKRINESSINQSESKKKEEINQSANPYVSKCRSKKARRKSARLN